MKDYIEFLDNLFVKLNQLGFDVKGLQLDHIAYYTSSNEEYDLLKPEFEKLGRFDHEAIISERRVGVVTSNSPILYREYTIEALELIEPKLEETHSSGWEHAEFVTSESFDSLMKKYPNAKWDTGSINRPLYSHLTAILDKDLKVKFHPKSVLESIQLERELKASTPTYS